MSVAIRTNSLSAFIKAARPQTLGAMACPVLIGSALASAHGQFLPSIFVVTLLCAILIQVLTNLVNDHGDFTRGSDSGERLGPPRAMQMGWLSDLAIKRAIALSMLLSVLLGLLLVERGGWAIFGLGIIAIGLSFWYTAGPKPLAYLGYAEIAVALFFGPVPVVGTYYLQTLSIAPEALVASVGPACLSTALIMTNNLRDINQDRHNHKKTLAVRWGESFSRSAIVSLLIIALVSPCLLVSYFDFSSLALSSCLVILGPISKLHILFEPVSRRFNMLLASTGKALYLYGVVLSLALTYHA